MDKTALWSLMFEVLQVLGRCYGPEMDRAAVELKLPGRYGWLLSAWTFDPESVSASQLRVRSPYNSARLYDSQLVEAAGQGFLAPVSGLENAYGLTALGRQAAERVVGAAYAKMAALQPMPAVEMDRLAELLHRLVMACLAAPEPPGKWCIAHSRRNAPEDDTSAMIQIDQYLSDLAAYRDDAHLATWQPLGVEGYGWEVFTFIWREEAGTLDELCQKLEHRGYSREEYKRVLEYLIAHGWVKEKAGSYFLTPRGQEVRQEAEEATNHYFYKPWSCLSHEETETLQALLALLCDGLQPRID